MKLTLVMKTWLTRTVRLSNRRWFNKKICSNTNSKTNTKSRSLTRKNRVRTGVISPTTFCLKDWTINSKIRLRWVSQLRGTWWCNKLNKAAKQVLLRDMEGPSKTCCRGPKRSLISWCRINLRSSRNIWNRMFTSLHLICSCRRIKRVMSVKFPVLKIRERKTV